MKSKQLLLITLFLQFIFYFTAIFDIPIARQVIGFLYFTFIPGFILVRLLKLNELNLTETLLFTIGFSIAFLMLGGLIINELFFLFGISQPLSLTHLIITFNSIILIGGVLVYLRSDDVKFINGYVFQISPSALLLICLPIFSIVGAIWVNVYGNNLILLFMIMGISLLFVVGVLYKNLLPRLYPFAILMIAIALLYHSSFISNYFVTFGSDVAVEYFAFRTTEINAYWNSTGPYVGSYWSNFDRVNSMLSVTILPTVYCNLLNMDPVWIFKIIFPLIFSFVPLGLFELWQKYIDKKYAFISTFLFMAQETFYTEMFGLNRQIIAELFFILLLLVITNKKMKYSTRMLCFMIFSVGLVTSHYGIAEILLFFISIVLIYLILSKRLSRNITLGMFIFFFVVMFSWYIFISRSAVFESFLEFGDYVYRQLGDFFNPETRGETVLRGLGLEAPPTIWNMISRLFAYFTQALIVVGFLGLIMKRVKINFEREYFAFTIVAMVFLGSLILIPGLANTMNITRFYHVLLFFLAPLCALGVKTIVNIISKRSREIKVSTLLLVVLIPYFLFQSSFVYEVVGSTSWSVPLSKYRMNPIWLRGSFGYLDSYRVFGARWVQKNVVTEQVQIYSDIYNREELKCYGLVHIDRIKRVSNATILASNDIVYLGSLNVIDGIVVGSQFVWNTSELQFLDDIGVIYANGGSHIYRKTS
jgi:uncharacterized membrane protein